MLINDLNKKSQKSLILSLRIYYVIKKNFKTKNNKNLTKKMKYNFKINKKKTIFKSNKKKKYNFFLTIKKKFCSLINKN